MGAVHRLAAGMAAHQIRTSVDGIVTTDDDLRALIEQLKGHTPGPWYMRTNRHTTTDGRAWGWIDTLPPGGDQRPIPGVRGEWERGDISERNLLLVSYAPDLLAAIKSLLAERDALRELLRRVQHEDSGGYPVDLSDTLRSDIDAAIGAFAQANGSGVKE